MANINFSVPDEVKREFEEAFSDENKSAVITRLMKQAVEEHRQQRTRTAAIEALLKLRSEQRSVSDEQIQRARHAGRA